jgi:hypothetical protein
MSMHTAGLLPEWLGIAGAAGFVLIAASHLRHLAHGAGQRRAWHAGHVLIATGMAFMYAPAAIDPLDVPAGLWQLLFAGAGAVAALWALNGSGRVPTLMWLLTAIDLGAMFYMWSAHAVSPWLSWPLIGYFATQSGMWALDAFRRLDGRTPIISWSLMSDASGTTAVSVPVARVVTSESLIGGLDIGLSMIVMTLGMAYMLAAMLVR